MIKDILTDTLSIDLSIQLALIVVEYAGSGIFS